MNTSAERRRDFSVWLRTGRWPKRGNARGLEFKFNPYHDPANGQFTSADGSAGFAPAAKPVRPGTTVVYESNPNSAPIANMAEADVWRARELAKHGDDPEYVAAIEARYQAYRNGFLAAASAASAASDASPAAVQAAPSASRAAPSDNVTDAEFTGGGGGHSGGAGASGEWEDESADETSATSARSATSSHDGSFAVEAPLHREMRNDYEYIIDDPGRTRRVSGKLTLTAQQIRSRAAQAQAGGADRRASDDGGHYIAARFNGPTDAFNHFAQDANFNRGAYRALEDQWARAKRAGRRVSVKIVPVYQLKSIRPAELNV